MIVIITKDCAQKRIVLGRKLLTPALSVSAEFTTSNTEASLLTTVRFRLCDEGT